MEQPTTTLFATTEDAGGKGRQNKRLLEHKRSFIFHYDEMNVVMELGDAEAGRFLKSIIAYAVLETGLTVRSDIALSDVQLEELIAAANSNGILHVLFRQFLMHFRTDTERYRRRVKSAQENGRKGGAPKGNSNARSKKTAEITDVVGEGNVAPRYGLSAVGNNADGFGEDVTGMQNDAADRRKVTTRLGEGKSISRCKSVDKQVSSKRETTENNPKQAVIAKDKAKVRAEGIAEVGAEGLGKAPDGAKSSAAPPKAVSKAKSSCDYHRLMEHFNSLFAGILPEVKALGDSRRKAVRARMAEYGEDSLYEALEKVRQSAFLTGGGRTGWRATFDWIFKPQNFAKIIEGNYDRLRTEFPGGSVFTSGASGYTSGASGYPSATSVYPSASEREQLRNEQVKQHIFEKAMAHIRGTTEGPPPTDFHEATASFITRISTS